MKINEDFIKEILEEKYKNTYMQIYDNSPLIQYLDKKMKAVHGNSKSRRSLANIYAIYSITHYYVDEFFEDKEKYKKFEGYDYIQLFAFYRDLYGGSKLQNHGLNNRAIGEFRNKTHTDKDLFVTNNGKYLIHIDYLYSCDKDITKTVNQIVEKYIELLCIKDNALIGVLSRLAKLTNYNEKRNELETLLTDDAEARIFEIISYAILKNHYKNQKIYIGTSRENIREEYLQLYKTGRTNANDGGIDFVMRPLGRFFQVTEVNSYGKYLLDIDKVMHFPISFIIKTTMTKANVLLELNKYIEEQSGGMEIVKERYRQAIEEIITINEIKQWIYGLENQDIDSIIRDMDIYFKLEMNLDDDNEIENEKENEKENEIEV